MRTSVEGMRGCGMRAPGGLYLVGPALGEDCARLPLPVESCPTCGSGIKPARGWTWIVPAELFGFEAHKPGEHSVHCPLGMPGMDAGRNGIRSGLLWIGESFYPQPADFIQEAARMGVSRRISAVPRGFERGFTYVFMGHRRGGLGKRRFDLGDEVEYMPAIVTVFRPTAIEYVVRGDETAEELEALEKRGIEPVKVIPENEQARMALVGSE